jgi:hypothetical protein
MAEAVPPIMACPRCGQTMEAGHRALHCMATWTTEPLQGLRKLEPFTLASGETVLGNTDWSGMVRDRDGAWRCPTADSWW